MQHFPSRVVLFLAALASIACASAAVGATSQEALKTALKTQADRWDTAIVRKDRAAIAANMSDSFRQITSNGELADKAAFIANITSPDLEIDPYTVDDFSIRLYGDTAIINGATDMHGTYRGKPFRSHYRYTDVYVRETAGWRVVNIQTTRIAE